VSQLARPLSHHPPPPSHSRARPSVWRGPLRRYRINAEQRFYKQEYCGCSYSLRDSNIWRKQNGIPPVRIGGDTAGLGSRYFEDAEADAREESAEVVDAFFSSAERHFDSAHVYKGRKRQVDRAGKDDDGETANNW
jgi:hypothetical protein